MPRQDSTDWRPHSASETAIKAFEQRFARAMGSAPSRSAAIEPYRVIPTGSLDLDYATRIGGYPLGRVVELWGPEAAGKSSLAMLAVASAQRTYPDRLCAWVDMEQTFDPRWATALGVDLTRLSLVRNPRTAEDVADAHRLFVQSGLFSLAVVDSVGAMITKAEYDKNADEDARIGAVASIVTRMVKACSAIGKANDTVSLIVNQVRARVDGGPRGPQTQTSGPWALRHVTSLKLRVGRGGDPPHTVRVDGTDIPVGYPVAVKVEKNKCAAAGPVANLWLANQATERWGPVGVDQADEATTMGIRVGTIKVAGSWYTTPDEQRHQGRERVVEHLRVRPELVQQVREAMVAALASQLVQEQPEDDDDPLKISEVM